MPDTQTTIHDDVAATLKRLEAKDKGLKQLIKKAYGHAVFPSVGKAAVVVGGSYGRGVVFEKGKVIGYATITQLTLGVQIGGDTFSEVVIFESKQALDRFKQGAMAFAANASAVLVKAAAAGTADFPKGVKALAYSRGGMLLEAAIGAQKFKFKPAGEDEQQDEDQQEESPGNSRNKGNKAKASASSAKQQGKGRSSGKDDSDEGDEQEQGEDESPGLLGRAASGLRSAASGAGGIIRDHPVAATLVGVGLAGAAMLVVRKLRSGGSSAEEGDEEDDSQEQDDQPQGSGEQDDEQGDQDQDEGGDAGSQDQQGGGRGDMLGFLRRRRSRA